MHGCSDGTPYTAMLISLVFGTMAPMLASMATVEAVSRAAACFTQASGSHAGPFSEALTRIAREHALPAFLAVLWFVVADALVRVCLYGKEFVALTLAVAAFQLGVASFTWLSARGEIAKIHNHLRASDVLDAILDDMWTRARARRARANAERARADAEPPDVTSSAGTPAN